MPLRDWLAALIVITAWGVNFVVIKLALTEIPPMLLGGLRFTLVAFPAIFFVKRPQVPLKTLIAYGLAISLGQFVFLFTALYVGMPAGLASLVLQAQAFFTVLIAVFVIGEKIKLHNIIGVAIGSFGLILIHLTAEPGSVPFIGLLFTLLASLCWSIGNIIIKTAGKVDMFSLVIWGAAIPPIPFYILSYFIEGPELIMYSLQNVGYVGVLTVFYLAIMATVVGYVLWGRLMNKHAVSKIAPLSLMVPVLGIVSAAVFLDERLVFLQWIGSAVVLLGLAINIFGFNLLRLNFLKVILRR